MGNALRCLAVVVAGLALVPGGGACRAPSTAIRSPASSRSSATSRPRTTSSSCGAGHDTISRVGGGLTNFGTPMACSQVGNAVRCPRGTSFSVDLGAGNDSFRAPTVGAPISVAGGPGADDLATGGGADVLAGGADGDTLDGRGGVDEYFGETGDDTIEARDSQRRADLLRRRPGRGAQRLRRHHRRVRARHRRRRRRVQLGGRLQRRRGERLPRRGRGLRQRRRRELRRARQPQPRRRRGRLPAPARLRRRQRRDPADRARDPRQRGRRELRPARRAVRRPRRRGRQPVGVRRAAFSRLLKLVVHNAPAGARVTFRCTGRSCPTRRTRRITVRERPDPRRAAPRRSGARACDPARGCG